MATQNTEYWNYVDVFAYALALSDVERFTADPERWHSAIDLLKKQFVNRWPEAFDAIYFERRAGSTPYSPQVEHFLHVTAQGGKLSAPNPAYVVLEMNQKQRKSILEQNDGRLADWKEIVREMSSILQEELAIEE